MFCAVLYIVGLLTPTLVVIGRCPGDVVRCGERHLKKLKKSYEMKCLITGTDSIT